MSVPPGRPGNLAALLERRAREGGWQHATAYVDGRRVVTHGEVHDAVARTASVLHARGVGRGSRVMIVAPDGLELVWAFLGAIRLGAIAIPVNPALTAGDHRFLVEDARPSAVVTTTELAGRFGAAPVVEVTELAGLLPDVPPFAAAEVAADDPAYAQYTSGTTGAPKAAVHRHGDAEVYAEAFARPVLGLGPGDVLLSVSKMFFAYGLGNSVFFPLLCGCPAVLNPGAPSAVADLVRAHGVTVLFAVPTFYARLVATGDPAAYASLRLAVSAGEVLTAPLRRRTEAFLGCPLIDSLGSTEVGQAFVASRPEDRREGAVGRALKPYEIAVRDDAGREVPPGRQGLLWVRGPTVLSRYLNRPEPSASVRDGDWLCTGDRARQDDDGFVHLAGRADDIERVAGMAVAPGEVEEVLAGHRSVCEVAVAGVRLDDGSSRLEAFVVLRDGLRPSPDLESELVARARDGLAPHKVPRMVRFVDRLPRTPNGKLQRFALRAGFPSSRSGDA